MAFLRGSNNKDQGTVLYGEHLSLRAPKLADYEQWAALRIVSSSFLRPYEPSCSPSELSKRSFRKRIDFYKRGLREGSAYSYFLKRASDERLIGGLTLSNVRYGVISSASLGYWIGAPFARKGHMSEASRLACAFAFDVLQLHRLEAACLPQNLPSIALLHKNGFAQEGVARKYLRINGVWQDHLLFAQLEDDYRER